jgi:dolichyl-phosphate-mannose-protein mannosyltransferase
MTRFLKHALGWWAAISFAVAIYDLVTGGFHLTIAGIRLSSVEAYKPFRNGIACACAAFWLRDREAADNTWWHRLVRWGAPMAVGAAAISALLAVRYGIFVAGGSDAYGYVSEAALWARGQLIVPEPLAPIGRELGIITATLGYRPALVPDASVPTYAPGYPMLMALATKVAGDAAVFFVVPLCAALVVLMTYLIGARFAGPRTGFLAAVLLACSPMFLFESLEPMSDVPVTMWFLVAWWLLLHERPARMLAAGLATSGAMLTRPNLAPLAGVLLFVALRRRPRVIRGLLFGLGTVPGVLAVAAINRYLYGTASMSGYGSLRELFDWANVVPNLQRYPVWLVQLHTPAILIALAAPLVARREPEADRAIDDPRLVALWMIAFGFALLVEYLLYGVFEDWPYLRFLLPVIPLLFVLASNICIIALQRMPTAIRGAAVFTICVLLGTWYFKKGDELGVYKIGFSERRYVSVGQYLEHALPPEAVVFSVIQSGSVRLYGKHMTLRWDEVPASKLDHTLDVLRARGYAPYILLEEWEEPMFRARFGPGELAGRVDWPPAIVCYAPITVRIYNPADRVRYIAGERWLPKIVPHM